ncbi:MAG TPA: VCBS repeat-containing protein [Myxococcales bacterium]|jgi:hypothetical protein
MRTAIGISILLALACSGCSCGGETPGGERDGGTGSSADADDWDFPDTGSKAPDAGESCGAAACVAPMVCRFDTCVPPPPSCTGDANCENDTYCEAGECIPYGVGPRGTVDQACKRLVVLGVFAPRAQCEWTAPPAGDPYPDHRNVLATPLVADFNFDGDPKTLHPSIAFMTYDCEDGSCGAEPGCSGVIRIIDGETCAQQYSVADPDNLMIGSVTPAIGDLDGDGRPEIVGARQGGGVIGFRFDPAAQKFSPLFAGYSDFNGGTCHWDSLAIHDLDDDGVPEIVQNGPSPAAYDVHGSLIDGLSTLDTTYSNKIHPVLADLDGDGAVEMVDGREAVRFDKATKKWSTAYVSAQPLGQPAIADFGTFGANPADDLRAVLDGIPEIVVVSAGEVRVQTLDGRAVFGPLGIPAGGTGGAPTVADFDGDGRAEFGVAGADAYSVFDPDCVAGADPALCPTGATDGVLWSRQSQDHSSKVTGSSVFDFEGDGKAEVVYADECFSRVYDGRSGAVLFSQHHTSCTWYENVIVADVDGDFRSEVVIPSNANCNVVCPAVDPIDDGVSCDTSAECFGTTTCAREQAADSRGRCRCTATADCGSSQYVCEDPIAGPSAKGKVCRAAHPVGVEQQGILVMSDVLDRWVGSRSIWNQHAYAVTNVNDDGTIPRTSAWKANWKDPALNNFRMNVQGSLDPEKIPDLTSKEPTYGPDEKPGTCVNGTYPLKAKVCNRGTAPVAAGLAVTFYRGAKTDHLPICTAKTTGTLNPGDCEAVGCDWKSAPTEPTQVTVAADDDGSGKSGRSECEEGNNLATLPAIACDGGPT